MHPPGAISYQLSAIMVQGCPPHLHITQPFLLLLYHCSLLLRLSSPIGTTNIKNTLEHFSPLCFLFLTFVIITMITAF